jgi:predicted esterase
MRRLLVLVASFIASIVLVGFTPGQDGPKPSEETIRRARQVRQQITEQFRDKKYEEAATSCRELIKLLPQDSGGHYDLACALARLGKPDDAFASLARSLELGYADAEHMQGDDDLAELRKDKRFAGLVEKARDNRKKALARLPVDKGVDIAGVQMLEGNPDDGLRWRLRLSPKATADKPHRLVVWLHPSGGSMNNVVEALAPRVAEHGFALLVLTQKQYLGWSQDDAQRLLEKTLPDVARHKEVDVRRPVLLGYSAGGQMALELWHSDPMRWGGLVLDAAYPVRRENGKFVPKSLPKNDGIKKVPFLVLVGDKDGGSALWKQLTPKWREAGVPLTIRHIEGKGHTWLFGKAEVALLEKWLEDVAAGKLPADAPEAPKGDGM